MCPLERVGELAENAMCLGPCESSFETQALGERLAPHVTHHEIPDAADFAEGVQSENVRMRQLRGDACFAAKPLATLRCGGEVRTQHFDGYQALERALAREIDVSHAASSNRS